jgi:hypothetical protein
MNKYIGRLDQPMERRTRFSLLEIEKHRALIAIYIQKENAHAVTSGWTKMPHVVTAGRLDLDDIRAHVTQDLGADRS